MGNVKVAAGLLMCRSVNNALEFFLVHPGGPFFKNKDAGFWTIPKGEPGENEALLDTAIREFEEETGIVSTPPYRALGEIKQKAGKIVHAWAFLGEWNPSQGIRSNTFNIEWPPRSGKIREFPEIDKAGWMDFENASKFIIAEQLPFLERATTSF